MDPQLRCVYVANGEIHAQQIRTFLEAAGISAVERGESLSNLRVAGGDQGERFIALLEAGVHASPLRQLSFEGGNAIRRGFRTESQCERILGDALAEHSLASREVDNGGGEVELDQQRLKHGLIREEQGCDDPEDHSIAAAETANQELGAL